MIRQLIRALLIAALAGSSTVIAAERFDPFTIADIEDRLGVALPRDLSLHDEAGRPVRLSDYFAAKPLLLAPVDFACRKSAASRWAACSARSRTSKAGQARRSSCSS